MELIEWLKTTDPETAEYFGALCKLYSSLARGRNLRTTPVLQKLLPCKLVVKIIRLCAADERFLPIAQSFVSIASDLYINNDLFNEEGDIIEAHPPMVKVTHVRVWEEVESIAATGALSSKKNSSLCRRTLQPSAPPLQPSCTSSAPTMHPPCTPHAPPVHPMPCAPSACLHTA